MFDIGWQELIVLGAVALVVFPPKEFPNLLKSIFKITAKVRSTTQEFQHHIHNFSKTHLEEISTEARETQNLIHDSSQRIQRQIEDLENRARSAIQSPKTRKKLPKKPLKPSSRSQSKASQTKAQPKVQAKTQLKARPKTKTASAVSNKPAENLSNPSRKKTPIAPSTPSARATTPPKQSTKSPSKSSGKSSARISNKTATRPRVASPST